MPEVCLFVNDWATTARNAADRLHAANIPFGAVLTSGPLSIWVDDAVFYGSTGLERAIKLLTSAQESHHPAHIYPLAERAL